MPYVSHIKTGSSGLHVNAKRSTCLLNEDPSKISKQDQIPWQQYVIKYRDANIRLVRAWTAIERLSITQKYDLSDEIKSCGYDNTTAWMHHMVANEMHWEKFWWGLYRDASWYFEQIQEATSQNTATISQLTLILKTIQDEQDMREIAGEASSNS